MFCPGVERHREYSVEECWSNYRAGAFGLEWFGRSWWVDGFGVLRLRSLQGAQAASLKMTNLGLVGESNYWFGWVGESNYGVWVEGLEQLLGRGLFGWNGSGGRGE